MLYTGSDLVADIGGYLGLFLGLSIFGLVETIEKIFLTKKPKDLNSTEILPKFDQKST